MRLRRTLFFPPQAPGWIDLFDPVPFFPLAKHREHKAWKQNAIRIKQLVGKKECGIAKMKIIMAAVATPSEIRESVH